MIVYIRTDANEIIASGHMMRCLSIAYEINQLGVDVVFLVSDYSSVRLVENTCFPFCVLETEWRQLNTLKEIERIKRIIGTKSAEDGEVLLVDSYYADYDYYRSLREYIRIAIIDDMCSGIFDVDLLINYNIYHNQFDYTDMYSQHDIRLLLGTDYVPLRDQFCIPYNTKERRNKKCNYRRGNESFSFSIRWGRGCRQKLQYRLRSNFCQL